MVKRTASPCRATCSANTLLEEFFATASCNHAVPTPVPDTASACRARPRITGPGAWFRANSSAANRWRGEPRDSGPEPGDLSGHQWPHSADGGIGNLRARLALRPYHLHAASRSTRAFRHARGLRADLGNL